MHIGIIYYYISVYARKTRSRRGGGRPERRRETQWILTEVKWAHTGACARINVCYARRL